MSDTNHSESAPATGAAEMPPASFDFIVSTYAMQAMVAMGLMASPISGEMKKDMVQARFFIDLLAVLQEKSKGNLAKEEDEHLSTTLYQLRLAAIRQDQA